MTTKTKYKVWTLIDWDGNPAGYEGHLVYCWAFLHSMLLKEPALRERVYGNLF